MNDEERHRQVISTVQTIAIQAMELPPDQRAKFVERAVMAIQIEFDRKHGADPAVTDAAARLQSLTMELVRLLEESGGSVGDA